jgi:hypothetical protein
MRIILVDGSINRLAAFQYLVSDESLGESDGSSRTSEACRHRPIPTPCQSLIAKRPNSRSQWSIYMFPMSQKRRVNARR